MSFDNIVFDEPLRRCLSQAGALARREGSGSVACSHILRVAAHEGSEFATKTLTEYGLVTRGGGDGEPVSADGAGGAERIPLSAHVQEVIAAEAKTAGEKNEPVELQSLLSALVSHSWNKVELQLEGLGIEVSQRDADDAPGESGYRTPREYLEDEARLWEARRAVVEAMKTKPWGNRSEDWRTAFGKLERLEKIVDVRLCKTGRTAFLDSLELGDLSPVARSIVMGLFVNAVYEPGGFSFLGPKLREFALHLQPDRFPENCGACLAAVRTLLAKEIVSIKGMFACLSSDDELKRPALKSELSLASRAEPILARFLEPGPITAEEVEGFRLGGGEV